MKTAITLSLLLLLSLPAICQKLTSNDVDKFTGEKTRQTNYVLLGEGIQAKIKTIDDAAYLVLNGAYGSVIGSDATVSFLLADQTQVKAYSIGIQSPTYSGGMSAFTYYYRLPAESLTALKSKQVTSMRRILSDGYADTEISAKHAAKFQKLCQLIE